MVNNDTDDVQFHYFDSINEVATNMVDFARKMHPTSRIVSRTRVISMLDSTMGSGTPVFGIAVFPSVAVGDDVNQGSDTIQDYTDHERMRICGCTGKCLNPHGKDCEREIIYERLAANLFSFFN